MVGKEVHNENVKVISIRTSERISVANTKVVTMRSAQATIRDKMDFVNRGVNDVIFRIKISIN